VDAAEGSLDLPPHGADVAADEVEVGGWALVDGLLPRAVLLSVNGESVAATTAGLERPDVVAAYPHHPDAGRSGWRCVLDLGAFLGTKVVLAADALSDDGTAYRLGASTVSLVTPPPQAALDGPLPGAVVSGALRVHGWCHFGDDGGRVDVAVAPDIEMPARLGMPRPDVATRLSDPTAMAAGFEALIALPDSLDGQPATVSVTATRLDGASFLLGRVEVLCEPAPLPTAEDLRRVAVVRGRVTQSVRTPPRGRRSHLRLLAATHALSTGGAQRWLGDLVKRWHSASELSVTVLAAEGGAQVAELEQLGCEVLVVGQPAADSLEAYEGHLALLTPWLSRGDGFDVAFINTVGMYPAADVAQRMGIPTVWAIHESYDLPVYWAVAHPGGIHPHVRLSAQRALEGADELLFVAEATRRQYARWLRSSALINIGGAVDIRLFGQAATVAKADARRRLRLPLGPTPIVLCLGTIEPRKGQTPLARAFLRATSGTDALLAIVGRDPDEAYGEALRAFLLAADPEGRVRFEGESSDVLTWLAAADLLVSASDVESLPLVLLEAMAAGTPVLATSIFGVPELVVDGETGWLVAANDEQALAERLQYALSTTEEERRRIAGNARQRVVQHHDLDVYASKVWDLVVTRAGG
jgi:D-inositol-3-phosphate glycosyltransferase